jgi:hypothetical protein
MTVVHNRLHASIHGEHLEEAALLYERRRLWLEDPFLTLHDLAELEERQEAHLDGLVVGAPQTLGMCERAIAEGDAAELHVGVRIACRCGQSGFLGSLALRLRGCDEDELGEFEDAASAALSVELACEWAPRLADALEDSICGPIVAEAVGRRRIPMGSLLLRVIAERGIAVDQRYVRALGELRYEAALPELRGLLGRAPTPTLWSEVALACLKLHDRGVAALVASSAQISAWSPIAQAIVFEAPSAWFCRELENRPTPQLLTALALRGDPSSLPICVDRLADDELGDAAAAALLAITGAELFDDPSDASEDEENTFDVGPIPTRCRDPERWTAWLDQHTHGWRHGTRYRFGRVCTPAVARACLGSLSLSLDLREAIRDELTIRHGESPTHVSAPAHQQLSWLAAAEGRR